MASTKSIYVAWERIQQFDMKHLPRVRHSVLRNGGKKVKDVYYCTDTWRGGGRRK